MVTSRYWTGVLLGTTHFQQLIPFDTGDEMRCRWELSVPEGSLGIFRFPGDHGLAISRQRGARSWRTG